MVGIPALNEAATIADVIERIPRDIEGIDEVVVTVVDDGSTDDTEGLARAAGAEVVRHHQNSGVGVAFRSHDAWRSLFRDASLAIDAEISTHVDIASVPRFMGLGVTKIVNHTFLLRADTAARSR